MAVLAGRSAVEEAAVGVAHHTGLAGDHRVMKVEERHRGMREEEHRMVMGAEEHPGHRMVVERQELNSSPLVAAAAADAGGNLGADIVEGVVHHIVLGPEEERRTETEAAEELRREVVQLGKGSILPVVAEDSLVEGSVEVDHRRAAAVRRSLVGRSQDTGCTT